jgi:thiol-disulfide isomerase/thioredoxin
MILLRFSALWCPSCLVMKSRWNEVLKMRPELTIVDFDYDKDEAKVKEYQIGTLLPVVIFEENGVEFARIHGEKSVKDLIKTLEAMKR